MGFAAEVGDGGADYFAVGVGVVGGAIDFALDLGHGLEKELAEVAKGVGGTRGDLLVGEGVEDFAEDVINVEGGDVFAGERGEFSGQLFGFEKLLLFASVEGAKRIVAGGAEHAAAAAVGELIDAAVFGCLGCF